MDQHDERNCATAPADEMHTADPDDEEIHLLALPSELLRAIAAFLVPSDFGAAAPAWRGALRFGGACTALLDALSEALRESIAALRLLEPSSPRRTAWLHAIRSLASGTCAECCAGRWQRLRPLQAVRATSAACTPLMEPPEMSGASLCALGGGRLVLFGGRQSATGDTLGTTHLVRVSWFPAPLAQWDLLHPSPSPPPRCYHAVAPWRGRNNDRCAMVRRAQFSAQFGANPAQLS